MKSFLRTLRFESKRNLNKKTLTLLLIFLAGSSIFIQFGIDKYQKFIQTNSTFIALEQKKMEKILNVARLGMYGIKISTSPTKLMSLTYNSSPFLDLTRYLDYSYRLDINTPQKGANVFNNAVGKSNLDFLWYLLFFGTALVFIWGFMGSREREHLRFLLSFTTPKVLYGAIILSKILLILCFLIVSYLLVVGMFLVNGIGLSLNDLSYLGIFFLVAFLTMILFLILGAICGSVKSMFKASVLAILTWFVLIILIPEISNIGLSKHTDSIFESIYSHELKKLEIFSKAEEFIFKEVSKYSTPDDIKKAYETLIKDYNDGELQQILKVENEMLRNTMKAAKRVHFFNIFTPVTFFKIANNEISAYGFNGYIDFYQASIKHYEGFVKYCLENRMSNIKPKDSPFIKNEEDYIFHLESSLPGYFGAGVVLNLFYVLVAFGVGYLRFNRAIFVKPVKPGAYEDLDIKLEKGYNKFSYEAIEDFVGQLYNVFSGRAKRFTGNVSIEGESIVNREKQDFLYIPAPHDIPAEIKVKNMVNLFAKSSVLSKSDSENLKAELGTQLLSKRFGSLEKVEQVELLVKLAKLKKCHIIIVDNPFSEISTRGKDKFFEWVFNELKGSADVVLHLERPTGALQHKYDFYSVFYPGEEKYIEQRLK